MSVRYGNTETLCCNIGSCCLYDLVALDLAPYLQRLLLGLLLLAADEGDEVIHHLGPCLEILACARDSLISTSQHVLQTELSQGVKCGNIALDRAV